MAVTIKSATFYGLEVKIVKVEVDISKGLPTFSIVGLPDASVKESKERVRSAIVNSGFDFPLGRITINLAPADIKKIGTLLDLPIAIGLLIASSQINSQNISKTLFIGELSLEGNLRKINGALTILLKALENGFDSFILPTKNHKECILSDKIKTYPLNNLKEVSNLLIYSDILPLKDSTYTEILNDNLKDFSEVAGNESAKRALEIAAAGNHNILMFGPPGSGKTMLAERLPSILPSLSFEESLDVSKIYSVSGKLQEDGLLKERPFRAPHHTITPSAMVGGGRDLKIGEISLSHRGVLFLDELLEFNKSIIELLRQPLENKEITLSRVNCSATFPSDFLFVGAFNPCPCGNYLSSFLDNRICTCSENERIKYLNRLSKAILDRIDIFVCIPYIDFTEFRSKTKGEKSIVIKDRVLKAREIQIRRYEQNKCNSRLNHSEIIKFIKLENSAEDILKVFWKKWSLSNRALDRILKVSRTISDLDGVDKVQDKHILEALNYRKFVNGEII